MSTTGSDLNQAIQVLELRRDGNAFTWEKVRRTWAAAAQDDRANLFSSVGVGARGVTFTIRKSWNLTLYNAFLWRGQFCFLTAIMDGTPGFQTVKAALCDPCRCASVRRTGGLGPGNRPQVTEGPRVTFPGVLTEKYVRYAQVDSYARAETLCVLVTPKAVELLEGDLATVEEGPAAGLYNVQACHVLDAFKNEYEIARRRDV